MKTKFTFDGKTFNSLEEMPEEIRAQYQKFISQLGDKNQNGLPDLLEQQDFGASKSSFSAVRRISKLIIEGKEYTRLEDVPEQFREHAKEFFADSAVSNFTEEQLKKSSPIFSVEISRPIDNSKLEKALLRTKWIFFVFVTAAIIALLLNSYKLLKELKFIP